MNSQAPILMSAETAWPRRPTPRASSYTSPKSGVPGASASLGHTGSTPPSPYLNRTEKDNAENSMSLVRQETPRWRQNLDPASRLDPQKIARIAQAFGVNLPLPQSRSLDLHSPLLNSLALPSASHSRNSQQQRSVSANSSVLMAHSAGLISRAPSPLLSPARSMAFDPLSPRRIVSKSKHLVCVHPPTVLKSRYSQALLLLQPSYKAQLEAIAREYKLPTTVGLVLFLVVNTLPSEEFSSGKGMSRAKKPRSRKTKMKISQDTWSLLWGDIFDGSSAYHHQGSTGNATGFPESASQGSPSSHLKPLSATHSHNHSLGTLPRSFSASHTASSSVSVGHSSIVQEIPPFSRPSSTQPDNNQTRLGSQDKSLLHRSPSSLSPASFSKRNKPPLSLSRQPANRTPVFNSEHPGSAPANRTLQPARPLTATHFLTPPPEEGFEQALDLKPPELRIVGSLEFGIDSDRASEWWDAWIKKKGILPDATSLPFKSSRDDGETPEHSSFEDELEEESGYAQLEDEGEQGGEKEIDDLLEGMLPSEESEWTRLRDTRGPSSVLGKGKGVLQLSAKELSDPSFSSPGNPSGLYEEGHPEADEADEFTLNAREVSSMLTAHSTHPGPAGIKSGSSRPSTREGSAIRRPKNVNLTLDLDHTAGAFNTMLDSTAVSSITSSALNSSTLSNGSDFYARAQRGELDQVISPTSDASDVELAYLKRRAVGKTEGSSNMDTTGSVRMNPFGIRDDDDEVGNRGSALLMHDKLNDLENILRSLSPRDLSIPSRNQSSFPSLTGQVGQALLSPATIESSDPMDRATQPTRANPSSSIRSLGNGFPSGPPRSSTQTAYGNPIIMPSASISSALSANTETSPFDGSLLPVQKNSFPAQLPRASSHRSLEDTDSLSVKSRLSERPWAFSRDKSSPGHSSHDLTSENVFDLNDQFGSSDTSHSPLPSPQRPRISSSKSSKGFRSFRWGRQSEDASPPSAAEISSPIMSRPDMPASSHSVPYLGASIDHNDQPRFGEGSSPLVNQFGQRMDVTPDMGSSGFGDPMNLPSPTSPKDGRGSTGHSSRKRFKAPFSPGQLFGSKSSKNRPPMEISAPELISINNQASNGSPNMTAFHHRARSEHEAPQGIKGSPSMQALQQQQQQQPGKFPFADGLQSPPTSPNSISSPSSPRTVRRKPVPGMPSASPSIAALSRQMHRMSSASEESTLSPRSGNSMSHGIDSFTLAPPLPDSPLKTVGLGGRIEDEGLSEAGQRTHVVGLGLTRPSYATRPNLDESEGLA